MNKKIISWALAFACFAGLAPTYAKDVVINNITVYDFNDFKDEEIKWSAAKNLAEGYQPSVSLERDADGSEYLKMGESKALTSAISKTPYIIRMTDGIEYKEDKKIVIDMKVRTFTDTLKLDKNGRGPRLQMKYNLEADTADTAKLKHFDAEHNEYVPYSIGSNHLNLWEIMDGEVRVVNGNYSGTNWKQTNRSNSFRVKYDAGDWCQVRTVLDGLNGTADFYVTNLTKNISQSVTDQKLHFTNGNALKSVALANFYYYSDDTYDLDANLNDTNIEYLRIYEADDVDESGEMIGDITVHVNDEFEVQNEGFKIAKGFESRIELSEQSADGVDFMRMHTVKSAAGNASSPYIHMPVNEGKGIEYKEGKYVVVETKFRTDTQVYDWKPDARIQLKYNLPDDYSELKNIKNTDSDGYSRNYNVSYNDCNIWGCEGGGFRGPNSYTVTGTTRQTAMKTLNVPFSANRWYIIKAYIDGINNNIDYEITDCETGKLHTVNGFTPYFSLGDSLNSIAICNFKEPVNNSDFDYVKVYECTKEERDTVNLKYTFEDCSPDGITVKDSNKFKYISGNYANGMFAVLTGNDAYSIPVIMNTKNRYLISLKWKAEDGESLAITADGQNLSGETIKDGEWNVTKTIYTPSSDKTVSISTNLSADTEYYIDDYIIEEIIPESIQIEGPDRVAKGSNKKYQISLTTSEGEKVSIGDIEYKASLSGTEKSYVYKNILSVSENEKIGKFILKVDCNGIEATKEIEVFDEIESEITYEDIDGNPLKYGISDNGVSCNIKVTNHAEDVRSVTVAAAIYKGEVFSEVLGFKTLQLAVGASENTSFGPFSDFEEDEQLKVFVWKDMIPAKVTEKAEHSDVFDTLYVATYGDDSNSGTIDSPLKTLEGARDKIRALEKLPEGGVTVYIREGTYHRTSAFSLTTSDSGTKDSPIRYMAYEGEKPVFTQGIDISIADSKKVSDETILSKLPDDNAKAHLYSVDLKNYGITSLVPADHIGVYTDSLNTWVNRLKDTDGAATFAASPTTPTNEVFFDGEPLTVARYPNGDSWISLTNSEDLINCGAIPRFWEENMVGSASYIEEENRNINDFFTIRLSDRVDRWVNAKDALMFGFWYHNWATQTVGIGSIDVENNTITSDRPSYFGVRSEGDNFAKYYVYNLIEELDTAGEYYFDRDNLKLYFYRSDNMTDGDVLSVSNGRYAFVDINGASDIIIDGLEFNVGRYIGINIVANDITVKNCTIKNLSDRAIQAVGDSNLVSNCTISNVNGGVTVSSNGSYKNNFQYGNSKVENCKITNFSRRSLVYTTAVSLSGTGNVAANNEMSGSYHMAMSVSGNDNIIQGNEIYDVCKFANDAAAVYMGRSWVNRGNKVVGNYIHDINPDPVWAKTIGVNAVFADDLFGNLTVSGNIFENIDGNAVKFNGGYDNVVTNNIFINCKQRGVLPGGSVTIGRYGANATTKDNYILTVSCVDQLNGLINSGYFNSCWEEDKHSVEEIRNVPADGDPDYYEGIEVSAIENFALFMKSDEWKANEEENIKKYINANWHAKYPEIYDYIVNHGGDTYGNVYKDNILINTDTAKTTNMTPERFADSGNVHYSEDVLGIGEFRKVDYSLLTEAQKNLQVSSEHMGINGVKYNDENPKGMIVNDDCETSDGFKNYNPSNTVISTGSENGVTYVRMDGTKTSENNNKNAGMLYDLYDRNIQFKEGEKIVIDTRLRYMTTSADGKTVPYMLLKMNMPISSAYADVSKVLSQKSTDNKIPVKDENGNIIMEERGYNNQLYDSTLVGFSNDNYAIANGYANGSNAKCTAMAWTKQSEGFTSLNQFTSWIRVVATVDMLTGVANYKLYNQNGSLLKEMDCKLANMSTDIYFNNVGYGIINAARGDVTIDVDYVKISIE